MKARFMAPFVGFVILFLSVLGTTTAQDKAPEQAKKNADFYK